MKLLCLNCGAPFERTRKSGKPQLHCSDKCRRAYATKAMNARRFAARSTVCAECGGPITQPTKGRPRRFCSEECKQRASNRAQNRRRLPIRDLNPPLRACVQCGASFTPKRRDHVYCTPGCVVNAYLQRKAAGEPLRQVEQIKICDECGEQFTAHKSNARWCSALCRSRFTRRVHSRRRGPVSARPYTDREIFERDGWRCHLCRKMVNRTVPRTHPDGATIDHIIPISLGGPDIPANVATAHNRCNREKKAKAVNDQLRLI